AGIVRASGPARPAAAWTALFAVAGLFHGYAYGESIFGAETSPLGAYLLGLIVIQSVVALGTAIVARRMSAGMSELMPRLAGAAIVGVGFAAWVGGVVPGP